MRSRSVTPRISIGVKSSDFVSLVLAVVARFAEERTASTPAFYRRH